MENQPQQRPCQNCHQNFPLDKVDLHQAYCFRNIKKCPKCQKMVDINQQQTHDLQEHSNKQCEMCKQQFSPQEFDMHQEKCPQKPVNCQYCQNTYALIQINKHKQSCGSRTQPCLLCRTNVMIKHFAEHTQKCQKRVQQRRAEQRRIEQRRAQVSQDVVRNRNRNQNQVPSRQNSQNVRDKRKQSVTKNVIQKPPAKVKPAHIIGPQSIKPIIDPVPISVRLAMKVKDQNRLPLKSKN